MRSVFGRTFNYAGSLTMLLFMLTVVSSAQLGDRIASQSANPGNITGASSSEGLNSYHVSRIQSDPVLGKSWATLVSCNHPERPILALPIENVGSFSWLECPQQFSGSNAQANPVVHAGEAIRVWKQERLLRIEVAGISEENGRIGQRIRVRILQPIIGSVAPPEHLSGTVSGPSDVEIQP